MPKSKHYTKMVGTWVDPELVAEIDAVTENRSDFIRQAIRESLKKCYTKCGTCGGLRPLGSACICGEGK